MYNSRTFWTLAGLILVAEMPILQQIISPLLYHALELGLGVVALYFHMNPSQVYTPAGVTPPASGESVTLTQP